MKGIKKKKKNYCVSENSVHLFWLDFFPTSFWNKKTRTKRMKESPDPHLKVHWIKQNDGNHRVHLWFPPAWDQWVFEWLVGLDKVEDFHWLSVKEKPVNSELPGPRNSIHVHTKACDQVSHVGTA